jgi:hypothetical protein
MSVIAVTVMVRVVYYTSYSILAVSEPSNPWFEGPLAKMVKAAPHPAPFKLNVGNSYTIYCTIV